MEAREITLEHVVAETGAFFAPPFDHPHIIAGQGTAALELLEEVDGLDAVIAPVGGGGLVSGSGITIKGLRPKAEVFAAEPEQADDAARSFLSGKIEPVLRDGPDGKELLIPVDVKGKAVIRARYEWDLN